MTASFANADRRTPTFVGAAKAALPAGCLALVLALILALGLAAKPASAQSGLNAADLPAELEGVEIVEHLNETIPLSLTFTDEHGAAVRLSDFFAPGGSARPVILVPGYYRCPMLCDLTRNGLVDAMNELDWSAGKEFTVLFVSINPDEEPDIASVKKEAYLSQYPREGAAEGLHFLTGDSQSIKLLTDAVGFGYRYDPKIDEYAHTATIMFVTPDGRLSRYMNNTVFQPRDMRLALIEASEGAIGSPMDKFLLFMCYHYDPLRNSYAASAQKLMRMGAALTAVLLAAGVGVLWLRGGKHDALGIDDDMDGRAAARDADANPVRGG